MIRKFDLLIALYVFGIIVAELMGQKRFPEGCEAAFDTIFVLQYALSRPVLLPLPYPNCSMLR
jgi:hypothetical protein